MNESPAMDPEELADYLPIYLDETDEQLDHLTEVMLVLEEQPGDQESLAEA